MPNPLPAEKFRKDPCLSLSSSQLDTFGLDGSGSASDGPLGAECTWKNSATGAFLDLQFSDRDPRGLTGSYQANEEGRWAYWVELGEIEGSPRWRATRPINVTRAVVSSRSGSPTRSHFNWA